MYATTRTAQAPRVSAATAQTPTGMRKVSMSLTEFINFRDSADRRDIRYDYKLTQRNSVVIVTAKDEDLLEIGF